MCLIYLPSILSLISLLCFSHSLCIVPLSLVMTHPLMCVPSHAPSRMMSKLMLLVIIFTLCTGLSLRLSDLSFHFLCCIITCFPSHCRSCLHFVVIWSPNTHSDTHNLLHNCVFRVTVWFYLWVGVFFICSFVVGFFPDLLFFFWWRSPIDMVKINVLKHRKKQQQTKKLNEHHLKLIWHFVLSQVCMYVCMYATDCIYCHVHEACQLMNIFVNTECNVCFVFFVLPFPLFSHSESFFIGCSRLCFFSLLLPLLPTLHYHIPSFICHLWSVLSSLLCVSLFGSSFLLSHLPSHHPHLRVGHRKLVDCPQLLDVDDMVKMREPDWKCVYTYLQEFYRGLVTKGLVKTKNSS